VLLGCCDDVDDDSPDSSSSSVGFLFLEFESEEDLVLILLDEGDTIGWILDRDGRGERERERNKEMSLLASSTALFLKILDSPFQTLFFEIAILS